MPIYKAFGSTFKISYFLIIIQSKIHTFYDASFWTSFFVILARPGAKKLDFGTPLAPSWAPNGAQNRASLAKMALKIISGCGLGVVLETDP